MTKKQIFLMWTARIFLILLGAFLAFCVVSFFFPTIIPWLPFQVIGALTFVFSLFVSAIGFCLLIQKAIKIAMGKFNE